MEETRWLKRCLNDVGGTRDELHVRRDQVANRFNS